MCPYVCPNMCHSHVCLTHTHTHTHMSLTYMRTQPVAVGKGDTGAAKKEDKKAMDKEVKKLLKDQADKCVCGVG